MRQFLRILILLAIQFSFAQTNSNKVSLTATSEVKNQNNITVVLSNSSKNKVSYYNGKPNFQIYYMGKWISYNISKQQIVKCANTLLHKNQRQENNIVLAPKEKITYNFKVSNGNFKVKSRFSFYSITHQKRIYSNEFICSIDKALLSRD
ncbi:hypothetical protein [Tenacibaculum sp. 190524A05c]|uniref:hypothetical protein n=1 Tax=Tenacibaculum platacis TaxID=3137852 RepID=UPI0032B1B175